MINVGSKFPKSSKDLIKKLKSFPDKVQKKYLRTSTRAGATLVAKEASNLSPKRTGKLSRSYRISLDSKSSSKSKIVYQIGVLKEVFYFRFIEMGTSTLSPKAPLRRALEGNQAQVISKIQSGLKKGIDKEAGVK